VRAAGAEGKQIRIASLKKENSMILRNLFVASAGAILLILGLHSVAAPAADDLTPEDLASRAEKLIDQYQGDESQLAEAEKDIAAALEKQKFFSHAMVQKARLIMIRGKESPESLQAAERVLQGARNTNFDYGPTYVLQGYVYLKLDNFGEADKALFTAKRLVPNDPWFLLNYAALLDKRGNPEGAREYREKLVASGITNRKMLYAAQVPLWKFYVHTRNRAKADGSYNELVRLTPDNAYLRGDYAQDEILTFLDFDAGERHAREALAIMDYPHARGTLSLALYGKWAAAKRDGKDPKAVATLLKTAQANDPDASYVPPCALESSNLAFLEASLKTLGWPRDNSRLSC
jgi:predicted Zn-dependent protease